MEQSTARSDRSRCRGRGDAGQVGIALALVVTAAATLMILATSALGRTVVDRTRARTAADAAALAGVTGGEPAARQLAEANGGVLEAFTSAGVAVEAQVRVGTARASSRAAPKGVGSAATGSPPAGQSARVPHSNAGL
jgi:hypothetical protein